MQKIYLHGITLHTLIGVYDWEREAKQALLVDVTFTADLSRAVASDKVEHTIDYAAVTQDLVRLADQAEFELLEALAGYLLKHLLDNYPIEGASVKITKPGILQNVEQVAVEVSQNF